MEPDSQMLAQPCSPALAWVRGSDGFTASLYLRAHRLCVKQHRQGWVCVARKGTWITRQRGGGGLIGLPPPVRLPCACARSPTVQPVYSATGLVHPL